MTSPDLLRKLLVLGIAALPLRAMADESFRCGAAIVSSSLSLAELVSKCGQPTTKSISTQDIRAPLANGRGTAKVGTTTTEKWRYDRGRRAFAMLVTIVDGRIRSIDKAPH